MPTSVAAKVFAVTAAGFTASTPAVSSIGRRRLLTCSASTAYAAARASRLVPQPPDLIRWVRREGGFVHPKIKIAVASHDDGDSSLGLTVVAAGDIPQGSELIALPSHIPLRFDRAHRLEGDDSAHSTLLELANRIPEELWAMRLGLRLLQERATIGSYWWPYISNLPEAFTVPIFFSGEDIKNLQYAPLIHQVNKRCRFLLELEKEVKLIINNVPEKLHPFGGQDVNASSLGWAMSAVSTRAFRLHGEAHPNVKQTNIPMLLPVIDMCNHSFAPNARIVQEQDANNPNISVKVIADNEIKEDMPVTLNYGCLTNDIFLLDYGFVVASNPYDHIELKYDETLLDAASMAAGISSPSFSTPSQWQKQLLSQLNLTGDEALRKVTIGGTELVDGRLLAALRILLTDDKETAQRHDLDFLMSLMAEAPVGFSVELAALRTAIALCVIALEHFPTKIMQDQSIFKASKGNLSSTTELAIQFRMQKKFTIINVMQKLTQKIKAISKTEAAPRN